MKKSNAFFNSLKKKLAAVLAVTMVLSLTACGSAGNAVTGTADSSAETGAEAEFTEATAMEPTEVTETDLTVTYPVTITDHLNREVTIEKQPETLVSGYYITTSLLIALGLDTELVGVEAKAASRNIYTLSAPEILELPSVGTAKEFDLEGCAALAPDLIIVPTKLKDSIPAMEELGLTVIAVNPEDQDLLFETIDMITKATNTVAAGENLKDYIVTALATLDTTLVDTDMPSVYLAGNSSLLETAGPTMYQNTLITNARGTNAAADITDTYWAEISYEQLLNWNPDYIILASNADYTVDSVLEDSNLADCTAVKEKQVYQLPSDIESLDSPVPGSFLGSIYAASVLHPEKINETAYSDAVAKFYETFYGFQPE
ncbi:MAG: ABC transporter substrate-binding protein [Lachnospiraceae bacterium]|nr:ABC transporter substrate-binding protein [Lachnospiraceae bacterium]